MGVICQPLRDSAKGQSCTFQVAGICNGDPETVVLCHAPSEIKGMSNKSHDYHAAFGCSACHDALDNRKISREDAHFYWLRAIMRTQNYWFHKGLMQIPGDGTKTRPKKKHVWPKRELRSRGFEKTRG